MLYSRNLIDEMSKTECMDLVFKITKWRNISYLLVRSGHSYLKCL